MSLAGTSSHDRGTVGPGAAGGGLSSKSRSSKPLPGQPGPSLEPYGQRGIRQYIWPAITTLSLILAGLSVAMWVRSFSTIDVMTRNKGYSTWQARSVIGRILFIRVDWADDGPRGYEYEDTGWQYSVEFFRDLPPDGWANTWKKKIGVDWGPESLYRHPAIAGGYWVRVRWPTVAVITLILPLARTFRHHLSRSGRSRRAKRASSSA